MLDLSKLPEADLSALDPQILTSPAWEAVKQEVVRRAHRQRSALLRMVLRRAWRRLRGASRTASSERRAAPRPLAESLFFAGRA
jgi:hypothetical protein